MRMTRGVRRESCSFRGELKKPSLERGEFFSLKRWGTANCARVLRKIEKGEGSVMIPCVCCLGKQAGNELFPALGPC